MMTYMNTGGQVNRTPRRARTKTVTSQKPMASAQSLASGEVIDWQLRTNMTLVAWVETYTAAIGHQPGLGQTPTRVAHWPLLLIN